MGQNTDDDHSVTVSLSKRPNGTIATVTLSNPRRLNSLNTSLLENFISTIASLSANPDLRCVVLTGGPCTGNLQAFLGGADISEVKDLPNASAARTFITKIHLACKALRDLSVPVIARVNGHALGGGLLVVAAADLRIAVEKAKLGMPEVRRGVPSTIESALLPAQIGAARARRLLLLGDLVSARTAEGWGLVDRVVADGELDEAVEEWVRMLLDAGPRALAGQKRLMGVWEQVPLQEGIEAGIWEFGKAFEEPGMEAEGRRMMNEFRTKNTERKSKL